MMCVLLCQVDSVGVVTCLTKHLDCRFHIKADFTLTCLQEQKQKDGPSATLPQSTSRNHFCKRRKARAGTTQYPLCKGKVTRAGRSLTVSH